ncbi:tripartite tricarboxylate transporter substrate binding protein [Rhodoplanes sp. Z2-YC6860]|uniref:tripartite tricarboxylate transporter substrate binding protein n=1 Tax=Rhodoplanes sp. Z2-YC6860 TaxID=674703 RepID=UPI00078DA11F|nr:tripartite tricarboxylate transporter substrate binding protein [Rhodoplanes sp. Z2-YC6860]AMN45121.1 tricarboxylate binding receptor [Rhodoplanes sp. Z2-YC6860]
MRAWALLLCALLIGGPANADDYPSKSIRLIVPFAAGGAVGAVARVLSNPLSQSLGQSIVIDNRGGAGGIIGMDAVAKAPPDGYTLLLIHSGITYMPGLYRKLPFDPTADFDGVIATVSGSYVLAVTNSMPFKTVAELIAYAKANPGKLSYGSAGIGSTLHLATEFFKRVAGIDMIHVPYKGASQATTDLVGGQVQVMIGPAVSIMPLAQAGEVRALAVPSRKRSALAPDLPTMIESGVPDFEVTSWYGLAAPAGTPKDILLKLNVVANSALAQPELIDQFRLQGYEPLGGTPEDLNALIKTDVARWTKIIRDAAIEPQ